jgi:hypothetical protein
MRALVRCWFVVLLFGSLPELQAQQGLGGGLPKKKPPAQETAVADPKGLPPSLAIKISDEPRGIDPATLLPKKLSVRATVGFEDKLLRDILEWLQKAQKLDVQLDRKALEEAAYDLYEPLNEELANEPVYLLLNRLRARGLDWYLDDGIIHLTTKTANENHHYTVSYLLSDLLDAGYAGGDELVQVLESTISPTTWKSNGGQGSAIVLGDVLFIRQTSNEHLAVAGLLAALKNHGRRTYTLDPPEHQQLRELLDKPVTAKIQNVPFHKAIPELSKILKARILVDQRALEEAAFDDRTLMTLEGREQKLRHLLRGLTANYGLTRVVRDGAIMITTKIAAENEHLTAVYDVRDLCRDDGEADALMSTIGEQAYPTYWKMNGGQGDMMFAKTGVMVVCQPEEVHDEVLRLLENYRSALRNSKPRPKVAKNTEPVKVFYRIPQTMAKELQEYIPTEVKPKTWRAADPNAPGTITVLTSLPEMRDPKGAIVADESKTEAKNVLVIPQAVLIVNQTEDVHEEIELLIAKISQGTSLHEPNPGINGYGGGGGLGGFGGAGGIGGGGAGGGGFGGGFFSVPSK